MSVLTEGQKQGCMTLSITNATDSPIAQASDFVIDMCSGREFATAATKTYSGSLMALAMLSAALTFQRIENTTMAAAVQARIAA